MFFSFICVICLGLCIFSCSEIKSYSDIPEINFMQLILENRKDDLDEIFKKAVLTFSFIDGEGNIGMRPQDIDDKDGIIGRVHYKWYKKITDNNYEEYQFPNKSITNTMEIPYSKVMDKSEAQNKTLKGTIELELNTPENKSGMDTMYVEFYILDRKANKSNDERTPDFSILSPSGTIIKPQK